MSLILIVLVALLVLAVMGRAGVDPGILIVVLVVLALVFLLGGRDRL